MVYVEQRKRDFIPIGESVTDLLDPVALEARLVDARARRAQVLAARSITPKAAARGKAAAAIPVADYLIGLAIASVATMIVALVLLPAGRLPAAPSGMPPVIVLVSVPFAAAGIADAPLAPAPPGMRPIDVAAAPVLSLPVAEIAVRAEELQPASRVRWGLAPTALSPTLHLASARPSSVPSTRLAAPTSVAEDVRPIGPFALMRGFELGSPLGFFSPFGDAWPTAEAPPAIIFPASPPESRPTAVARVTPVAHPAAPRSTAKSSGSSRPSSATPPSKQASSGQATARPAVGQRTTKPGSGPVGSPAAADKGKYSKGTTDNGKEAKAGNGKEGKGTAGGVGPGRSAAAPGHAGRAGDSSSTRGPSGGQGQNAGQGGGRGGGNGGGNGGGKGHR